SPVIPDSQYNMYRGPNITSRVILTYDDCPTSLSAFKSTVLAAEQADVGLALFPTGDCLLSGRFDAAFARAHGHHVFNHSITHPNLTTLSYSAVQRELGAPGVVTSYGRPPYGAHNATVRAAYQSVGMRVWLWNVDTNDWRGRTQAQVVNQVVSETQPGQTVLMHMQWNAFNGSAISQMKSGLNRRGIQVCRNHVGTVPVRPSGMWC
ncbi:MAG: polysaccharide deacetylase family protein, partial [Propionibacterium sp.]|nr:polysaccharide deacetylase family protein [Propionibacterium sp.]